MARFAPPSFSARTPEEVGGHAHYTVAKVDVTPGHMPNLTITETRSEQELEEYRLILVRVFEHGRISLLRKWGVWSRRSAAITRLNEFDFSVTFEKLEHDHKFVVHRTFAQTMFVAIRHELQDVLARDLVHKDLRHHRLRSGLTCIGR